MPHTFHIPVLGLGYSIDTPLKVARYGISSVLSIVDDELIERMREYHSQQLHLAFLPILKSAGDSRASRITAYLNFLADAVSRQVAQLKKQAFEAGSDICRYFELLPEGSGLKNGYELMMDYPEGTQKERFQQVLRNEIKAGAIDVNIMAKVDKMNVDAELTSDESSDALAALRGFALSKLSSSVILSAGMNPRLYSYLAQFEDFFPDKNGHVRKKIILKVSDFRSALIQAKFLAKKGLWVAEFRVESGLNCGGHAFATEGHLLGPILEEFKARRSDMHAVLFALYEPVIRQRNINMTTPASQRISVQGGIGTAEENRFLMRHYGLDATGWGSPFLLVPEATNVDDETLNVLAHSREDDYYLSHSSPLGIQFNNFKNSSINAQRLGRIGKNRPGSACTKKYLCNNTEFTEQPICTASRAYQHLKIKQLKSQALSVQEFQQQFDAVTEKICLCEGLCASTYLKYDILKPKESKAVAICPGPNLAYFSGIYALDEMVGHIYGRLNLLEKIERPHIFIKELGLYIDYFQGELQQLYHHVTDKKKKQLQHFKLQLSEGISYYTQLFNEIADEGDDHLNSLQMQLNISQHRLDQLQID
ncbi:hypothetical protein [Pedobacter sp. MR22-3]|uniref:hypothetical protein n=1 Tax=Pedobacter sp. MR22-3 TaxID=2994552 RepID=UPI0022484AD9|nr:hypothetical protein [Pedobacter sp. MR22-3]MCX2585174.1 hypothetical protein [Pedobacter sp. MR22-3]